MNTLLPRTKVLHVAPGLGVGGVGKVIETLLAHVDAHVESEVATLEPVGLLGDSLARAGHPIHVFQPLRQVGVVSYFGRMRNIIREGHFDVVHCHMGLLSGLVFLASWGTGVRVRVLHGHTAYVDDPRSSRIRMVIAECARMMSFAFANRRVACSAAAASSLRPRFGFRRAPVDVVVNGIDPAAFVLDASERAWMRAQRQAEDCTVLGFVGRLSNEKNAGFVLEVFRAYREKSPKSQLWMVGDGPDSSSLEDLATELGVAECVVWVGPATDVRAEMAGMDLFLLASPREGLGLVAVEAQAMGLPTFLSEGVPGEAEVSGYVTKLPLAAGPRAWADALLAVSSESKVRVGVNLAGTPYDASFFAREIVMRYGHDLPISEAGELK